ncbi:MAG: flavodoxin family protein, partial [Mesorhizobium sp.]
QQNGGDYHIPSMQLRPELGDPGAAGFALHEDRAGATAKSATPRSTLRDVA